MKQSCRSKELIRQICTHVESLLQMDPEAAKTEVLQHLKNQMKGSLEKHRFRDAEEMAYAILLELNKFSGKARDDSQIAR